MCIVKLQWNEILANFARFSSTGTAFNMIIEITHINLQLTIIASDWLSGAFGDVILNFQLIEFLMTKLTGFLLN